MHQHVTARAGLKPAGYQMLVELTTRLSYRRPKGGKLFGPLCSKGPQGLTATDVL